MSVGMGSQQEDVAGRGKGFPDEFTMTTNGEVEGKLKMEGPQFHSRSDVPIHNQISPLLYYAMLSVKENELLCLKKY